MSILDLEVSQAGSLIVRSDISDDDFLSNLPLRNQLTHASERLRDPLVRIIQFVDLARPWYLGETQSEPVTLLSEAFLPWQNSLCSRFDDYGEKLLLFKPGKVPIDIIYGDYRCALILLARLDWPRRDIAVAVRVMTHAMKFLWEQLTNRNCYDQSAYDTNVRDAIRRVVKAFHGVSMAFDDFEDRIHHPEYYPDIAKPEKTREPLLANANKILETVQKTQLTVQRLDERDKRAKKNARLIWPLEMQERCFTIWNRVRQLNEVKQMSGRRTKTRYVDAYDYAVREFREIGILSADALAACLGARSDRLSRSAARNA